SAAAAPRHSRSHDRQRRGVHAGRARVYRLHIGVQFRGLPSHVGAAGLVSGWAASWRAVRRALRRRGRALPPGRSARGGAAMARSRAAGGTIEEAPMDEHEIHGLLRAVGTGRLSRRVLVRTMVGCGLSVPVAGQLLAAAGLAQTSPRPAAAPAKRGGGGLVKGLSWGAAQLRT